MNLIITDHAQKRIRKRMGANKKTVSKLSDLAFKNGITHSETTGSLRRYCDRLYLSHRIPNNMRVYNQRVFLFKDNILITVVNLPQKYNRAEQKIKSRKIEKTT